MTFSFLTRILQRARSLNAMLDNSYNLNGHVRRSPDRVVVQHSSEAMCQILWTFVRIVYRKLIVLPVWRRRLRTSLKVI